MDWLHVVQSAFQSLLMFLTLQKAVDQSAVLCSVTYSRPQFQSYEIETLHAASTNEGAGFSPWEAFFDVIT